MSDDSDAESFHSAHGDDDDDGEVDGGEQKKVELDEEVGGRDGQRVVEEKEVKDVVDGVAKLESGGSGSSLEQTRASSDDADCDSPKLRRPGALKPTLSASSTNGTSGSSGDGEHRLKAAQPAADHDVGTGDWDDWGDVTEADLVTPSEAPPTARLSLGKLAVDEPKSAPNDAASVTTPGDVTAGPAEDWAWPSLLTDVLDSVAGAGLGAPPPELLLSEEERRALARKCDRIKEPKVEGDDCDSATEDTGDLADDSTKANSQSTGDAHFPAIIPSLGVSGFLSGFTKTGSTLVHGSLDVLESLGKRTFDALTVPQDDDVTGAAGGSRRLVFDPRSKEQSLSQVLRELKTVADKQSASAAADRRTRALSYAHQFELYEGTAQLEGLEMVADNCATQVSTRLSHASDALRSRLHRVVDVFDAVDPSADTVGDSGPPSTGRDFGAALKEALGRLRLPYDASRLIQSASDAATCVGHFDPTDASPTTNDDDNWSWLSTPADRLAAMQVHWLARLTAAGVQMVHKLAQLLLAVKHEPAEPHRFVSVCEVVCDELQLLTDRMADCINAHSDALTSSGDPSTTDRLLTDLFLEANNGCACVRNATKLLAPVVQLALVIAEEEGEKGGVGRGKRD